VVLKRPVGQARMGEGSPYRVIGACPSCGAIVEVMMPEERLYTREYWTSGAGVPRCPVGCNVTLTDVHVED